MCKSPDNDIVLTGSTCIPCQFYFFTVFPFPVSLLVFICVRHSAPSLSPSLSLCVCMCECVSFCHYVFSSLPVSVSFSHVLLHLSDSIMFFLSVRSVSFSVTFLYSLSLLSFYRSIPFCMYVWFSLSFLTIALVFSFFRSCSYTRES